MVMLMTTMMTGLKIKGDDDAHDENNDDDNDNNNRGNDH